MSKDQTHEFQNIACFTKSRKSYFIREREIDDRWISMIKIKEKIWTYLEKGVFSFVDFSSWIVNVLAKVYFRQKLFSLIGIFLFRFVLFSFILTSAEGTFPWIGKKSAEAIYLHFRVNYGKCQDKPIVRRDNYNSHRSENFNHGSLNYGVPILGFQKFILAARNGCKMSCLSTKTFLIYCQYDRI